MSSVIEKIFYKELGYRETVPDDKEYREREEEFDKAYEALEKTLNDTQKDLLSELYLSEGGVEGVSDFLYFKDGFFAGLRLGIEMCEAENNKQ